MHWRSQLYSDDTEVRKEATVKIISVNEVSNPIDQLFATFSDWRRLKTPEAGGCYCSSRETEAEQWYASWTGTHRSLVLTLDNLMVAEDAIIRYCQQKRFSEEISALLTGKVTKSHL